MHTILHNEEWENFRNSNINVAKARVMYAYKNCLKGINWKRDWNYKIAETAFDRLNVQIIPKSRKVNFFIYMVEVLNKSIFRCYHAKK